MKIKFTIPVALLIIPLLFSFIIIAPKTHADTVNIPVNLAVGTSCSQEAINGRVGFNYYGLPSGSSATLSFDNTSSDIQTVTVSEPGTSDYHITLNPGDSSHSYIIPSVTSVATVTGVPSCSSTPGYLYIEPAAGSMTCALSGGWWNLTGSFTNDASEAGIYVGSESYATYPANHSGPTTPISLHIVAVSPGETFILYDGIDVGKGSELAQATCPAYTPPVITTPKSTTPAKTTPTASTPATTPTTTPQTFNDTGSQPRKVSSSIAPVLSKPKNTPNKLDSVVLPGVSFIVLIIVAVGLLLKTGVLKLPPATLKRLKQISRRFTRRG